MVTKRPASMAATATAESHAGQGNARITGTAPFLAWPVSRRAFYRAIFVSLMPALVWGIVLFGVRPLEMALAGFAGATAMHFALKYSGWRRGKCLLLFHSLVGTGILVGLAHPTWPAWVVAVAALLLPLLFALLGGPGREPLHLAVVWVVVIQFAILPALVGHTYTGKPDALLARDRLFMGDVRNQAPAVVGNSWPLSRELGGDDAFLATPPALGAAQTLDEVSRLLPSDTSPTRRWALNAGELKSIGKALDSHFAFDLPPMNLFAWGVAPGRVGVVSLIAILLAGLHLSYRYILRPRSVLLFLAAFGIGTLAMAFTPQTFERVGPRILWDLFAHFPGQIVTLFSFMLLGSDVLFAAVFILALPGTEPLTPRGRRIFLVLSAVGAAVLHRYTPTVPAATICLTALMPFAPAFDRLFKHRSWLK